MNGTQNITEKSISDLLSAYYADSLTKSEREILEKNAETDSFLSEAMEGFNDFPEAILDIPSFGKSPVSSYKWISTLILVVVTAAIVFYVAPFSNPEQNEVLSEEKAIEKENKSEVSTNEKFIGMDNNIEEKSIAEVVVENDEEKQTNAHSEKTEQKREQIEIPKMSLTPIEFQEKIDYSVKKAKTKAIGFFGFLAVDYSQIYTNTLETEREFTGTAASQANLKENNSVLEKEFTRNVYTYREFLKQACYFMKERNFTNAITNFDLILEQFPRDVNAEFYLGYCHYELGNYSKAISYFQQAKNNGFDFFEEDAQWFIANSYENSGKYKEANKIYREIRKNGGYYSHKLK